METLLKYFSAEANEPIPAAITQKRFKEWTMRLELWVNVTPGEKSRKTKRRALSFLEEAVIDVIVLKESEAKWLNLERRR